MAHDKLHESIAYGDLAATTTGAYVVLPTYTDVRIRATVGGDVTGTSPTLIVTSEGSATGVGGGTVECTLPTIIDEQVGGVTGTTANPSIPGEEPVVATFNTGDKRYHRLVATIGGTVTPTFRKVAIDYEVQDTALRRSGTL